MIKKINKKQVANDFIMHIVAFSIAEGGAQGNPGRILFLTDKCEIYESSIYDKRIDELTKVYRSFNKCIKYIADRKNNIPEGIKYKYMGMGNHLFIVEWLDFLLDKEIPLEFLPGDIYEVWIEKCLNILKKNNHKKKFIKKKNSHTKSLNIKISDAAHKPTGGNKFSREKLYATWDSGVNKRKKIVAIGINPSTAKDNKSDMTVTRLCRFLDMYGFNNVEIINLFEDVSINQSGINKTTKVDFNTKRDLLDEADVILLVWGIKGYKEYKKEVKVVLLDYVDKLYCIKNQNGNYPVHPSRMPYESEIIPITDAVNFEKCGL